MIDESKPPRRTLRWAAILLAAGLLVLLLFALPRQLARNAQRRWEQGGTSRDELLARHPDVDTNAAAHEIEALADRLGIDLDPTSTTMGSRSPQDALSRYIEAEISRERSSPSAPPPEVAQWLRDHASDVETLTRRLLQGDAPRWADAFSRGPTAPTAHYSGHLSVQRVLAAAALDHSRSGRNDMADECLEAGWQLNDSLWHRTDLGSPKTAGDAARWHLGVLRKIGGLPESWDARLARLGARASFARVVRLRALAWMDLTRLPRRQPSASKGALAGAKVTLLDAAERPVLLAGTAAIADRLRKVAAADAAAAPCLLSAAELEAKAPPSAWNPYDEGWPSPTVSRIALVDFHAEMTRHVLRARRDRRTVIVTGPCPDWTFRTDVLPDGSVTVTFDGVLPANPWPLLPLRWGPDPVRSP